MDGSYSQSFEDIPDDFWQTLIDWDAANPFDMGTEATQPNQACLVNRNEWLTHSLLQCYRYGAVYSNSTCATCSSPLDASELALYTEDPQVFCIKSQASSHLPLSCVPECGLKFRHIKDLKEHCRISNHEALHCPIPGCLESFSVFLHGETFFLPGKNHVRNFHGDAKFSCHQCGGPFETMGKLDEHGIRAGHSAYVCLYPDCGSTTGRFNDLLRHQACHKSNVPRHPCPHCRTYRGNNGFKRKDHLRQHIRNYHKIEQMNYVGDINSSPFTCRQSSCDGYERYRQDLRSLDALTEHMLSEHNSSAFICNKQPCDRVGLNGFETDKLLKAHIKKEHHSPFQCTHPGCDRIGTKGWLREKDQKKHMLQKHGISA